MWKVAFKPEHPTSGYVTAKAKPKVSVHALSPLTDKILTGVIEAGAIPQTKVVPRYIRPLLEHFSKGRIFFTVQCCQKLLPKYAPQLLSVTLAQYSV